MPWSLLILFISVGMPPTTLTQQLHIAKQIIELFVLGTSVTCKAFFPSQYLSWVFRLIKLCWLTSLSQIKGTIRILNFQETQYISSKIPHYKLWWHKWILYVQDIYLQCLSLPLLPPLWDPATSPWSVWLVQLPLGFGEDSMGGSEQEESFDNPRGTFCHRWCGCLFCFRRGWGLKSKQRVKQQNKGWTSASSNCSLVITQAPLQWSKVHIWRFGQYYSVLEEI